MCAVFNPINLWGFVVHNMLSLSLSGVISFPLPPFLHLLFLSLFPSLSPSSFSPFSPSLFSPSLFSPSLFSPSPLPASSTLRQELEKERYFQKKLLDKPQCTCCEQRLGRLFNTGAPCPNCFYRVCKRCRVISQNPPPPFVCPVCARKRYVYTCNYHIPQDARNDFVA